MDPTNRVAKEYDLAMTTYDRRDLIMIRVRTIRRTLVQSVAGALFLLGVGEASAQVAWDAPLLTPPSSRPGWGVYLMDPAGGDDIGVMSTWRGAGILGFRIGIAEARRDDGLEVFGGVDVTGMLLRASSDFPLDIGWVAGAGLGGGDAVLASFPLGLTMGREFLSEGIRFTPYFTPRVVLDAWFGDDRPNDEIGLDFAVDIGADIAFSPRWTIRFAGSIGDRDAVVIGTSFHR